MQLARCDTRCVTPALELFSDLKVIGGSVLKHMDAMTATYRWFSAIPLHTMCAIVIFLWICPLTACIQSPLAGWLVAQLLVGNA